MITTQFWTFTHVHHIWTSENIGKGSVNNVLSPPAVHSICLFFIFFSPGDTEVQVQGGKFISCSLIKDCSSAKCLRSSKARPWSSVSLERHVYTKDWEACIDREHSVNVLVSLMHFHSGRMYDNWSTYYNRDDEQRGTLDIYDYTL